MQEKNNEFLYDQKKIVQKVNFDSDVIECKMQAYQSLINNDYTKAKMAYNDYLKISDNIQDNYTKADAFYSVGIGNYLLGEFNEADSNLKTAYEKVSNLPRINKNKILELKVLSNLCLLYLSISNFKECMDYCNCLAEIIKKETDKNFQKDALKEVMQIFFNTDSINSFFTNNVNLFNLNEKILINTENKMNSDYRSKIMAKIIFYFHKYLRDDDIESWIQCLNEESDNFKLINESNGFLIAIFNMYLSMYTKNPNITEKAKIKILSICKCIVNTKNDQDVKPLDFLLQECREKMRQASLIYKKLQNIEIEVEAMNTTIAFKKKDSLTQNRFSQNVLAKIFLSHAKNYLTSLKNEDNYSMVPFKYEQILNQIEITLELVRQNKIDLADLNVLDFDIDLAVAMKSLFENLLFIRYKFIIEKYFRKLMRLTFGYENQQMKIQKKQKKFEAFVTRKFLEICEGDTLIKINYSNPGKKEHYYLIIPDKGIRIYKKRPKDEIIMNPPSVDSHGKDIYLPDIKKITYGIQSENLRKRFKNMKNSSLKYPYLFFSFITKKRSLDLYMDEVSLTKWFYGISHWLKINNQKNKIMSTSKFLLTKIKLKMLYNLKDYYEKNMHEIKTNKYGKILTDIITGMIKIYFLN